MEVVQMHVIVYGKVQGVFFRDTTRRIARQMGLKGTVKNLSDGTVEIHAVGEKEKLERLVALLVSQEGPGRVTRTDINFSEFIDFFEDFQVIF